jgi:hypothetical protein
MPFSEWLCVGLPSLALVVFWLYRQNTQGRPPKTPAQVASQKNLVGGFGVLFLALGAFTISLVICPFMQNYSLSEAIVVSASIIGLGLLLFWIGKRM